jgi:hypothetical protein
MAVSSFDFIIVGGKIGPRMFSLAHADPLQLVLLDVPWQANSLPREGSPPYFFLNLGMRMTTQVFA